MSALFIILLAFLADRLLGEPRRFHPLVGFGVLANKADNFFNTNNVVTKWRQRLTGLFAISIIVVPFIWLTYYLAQFSWVFELLFLTFAIGWQSLREHGIAVRNALQQNNLPLARQKVAMIVSRDSQNMNEEQVCKATIESLLENGSDAIFSALFWIAIAGAPGVIAYRLINTLDAMWGYKTQRYLHFGWAAARLDDLMNYIPARLTAFSYFLASRNLLALQCWRSQAKAWKSPNAGPVMAAGAGSLNIQLGGNAIYHGEEQYRPPLGAGRQAGVKDIDAALHLIFHSILIWIAALGFFYTILLYANF